MQTWIALLRGVNVGGKNILPMADLRRVLDQAGFLNVRTYIQSGNCVFGSPLTHRQDVSMGVADAIEGEFGFRPAVLSITVPEARQALANIPFREACEDPGNLHLFFLSQPAPATDLDRLEALKGESEQFHLQHQVFYLHAPNGIARSKLAARAEKLIGVDMTVRNLRSIEKILSLAD